MMDANTGSDLPLNPTSRNVARRFGHYCDEARLKPIIFERHGAPQMVILSLDEYQRLKALDRRAFYPSELSDDDFGALKRSHDALAAKLELDTPKPQR